MEWIYAWREEEKEEIFGGSGRERTEARPDWVTAVLRTCGCGLLGKLNCRLGRRGWKAELGKANDLDMSKLDMSTEDPPWIRSITPGSLAPISRASDVRDVGCFLSCRFLSLSLIHI